MAAPAAAGSITDGRTVRALVFDGPGQINVADRPDPTPGPGEALLRVVATGICGTDLHGFTGENGRRHPGQVMGHETVAEVIGLGPGSAPDGVVLGGIATFDPVLGCGHCPACANGETQRCPERRVIGVDPSISAGMAELMVVPAANLVPIPAGVPADLGALVEPLAVGYHATVRGGVGPHSRVLVLGGGPIGQAVALATRRVGSPALAVSEPDAGRRALLDRLGVSTLDPTTDGFADAVGSVLGAAPDVVVDGVGSSASLSDALSVSTPGATVVLLGMAAPTVSIPAFAVTTGERTVLGSFTYSVAEFGDTATWVVEHPDELLGLIDARVDLDGAPNAFRSLADGSLRASKVLVYPNGLA